MCLTVGMPSDLEVKVNNIILDNISFITKKDTVVYKVLKVRDGKYYSPRRYYTYKSGTEYYMTGKVKLKPIISRGSISIYDGLHAYTTLAEARDSTRIYSNSVIVEFIIPEGTRCVKDNYNRIVCERYIWYKGAKIRKR